MITFKNPRNRTAVRARIRDTTFKIVIPLIALVTVGVIGYILHGYRRNTAAGLMRAQITEVQNNLNSSGFETKTVETRRVTNVCVTDCSNSMSDSPFNYGYDASITTFNGTNIYGNEVNYKIAFKSNGIKLWESVGNRVAQVFVNRGNKNAMHVQVVHKLSGGWIAIDYGREGADAEKTWKMAIDRFLGSRDSPHISDGFSSF